MPKKIWRKNFEIKKVDYLIGIEGMESFYLCQIPTVGKNFLSQGIWIVEKGDNVGTYFIKDELRNFIDAILKSILHQTSKVFRIHQKTIEYNNRYLVEIKKAEKLKLEGLTSKQLISVCGNLYKWLHFSHSYSLPTTWFVDSDGEDLTNHLLNYLRDKIEKNKLKLNFAESFSILTTPSKESFYQKEQKEFLEILKLIKTDPVAKDIFLQKDVKKIEKDLSKINKNLKIKILSHHKKWCWVPYTYVGPAYDLDYYLEIWSSFLRQKINIKKELSKLYSSSQNTRQERLELFKKIKIDKSYRNVFDLAAQIVWLKAYRKDVLFHGCYIQDRILKELGKRAGLSLMQMKHLAHFEINKFNNISANELNQRIKFSVIHTVKAKTKIISGPKAKAFLAKQFFEKVTIEDVSELKGTPACVGRVKGVIKVIDAPEEMGKMNAGDIMVSHATFPSLVPAMKKAAAIVTDDGGLTCHAAIVARELKTPCVVGTKIATKVLKDGDRVEVDANEGVVRKI